MPDDVGELLARIDERTKNIEARLKDTISRAEFAPVRSIVYGATAFVLLAVLGALVALTVPKPQRAPAHGSIQRQESP